MVRNKRNTAFNATRGTRSLSNDSQVVGKVRQEFYSLLAEVGLLTGAKATAEELRRAKVKADVNFMVGVYW